MLCYESQFVKITVETTLDKLDDIHPIEVLQLVFTGDLYPTNKFPPFEKIGVDETT